MKLNLTIYRKDGSILDLEIIRKPGISQAIWDDFNNSIYVDEALYQVIDKEQGTLARMIDENKIQKLSQTQLNL